MTRALDDRGVSTTLNYALNLSVTTIPDRLARSAGTGGTVDVATVESEYPREVAGSSYTISLSFKSGDRYELELSSSNPAVSISVMTVSKTEVVDGSVAGGPVEIGYSDTANELEVQSDND
ncbi:hypothetical protein BRC68_07385 [Halobacteriales archaeon QH_6_64_20]|nr:MAG: hypothetical protein BRC68_07385 [Halobacteriales archaeon QH_6_64_20]